MDKKYEALKEFQTVKFQDRFSYVINILKEQGINVQIPVISNFSIKV